MAYPGLRSCEKEIDKQEAEIKKNKKLKEKRRKLSWSVAAVTRKRGAENYFMWGLNRAVPVRNFQDELFQVKAKLSVGFESEKLNWKSSKRPKSVFPAMLKTYSASSFCLPNKNRVGVAHGDGTNLEVVYKTTFSYGVMEVVKTTFILSLSLFLFSPSLSSFFWIEPRQILSSCRLEYSLFYWAEPQRGLS